MTENIKQNKNFIGCLVGGAVGDALGAAVEFMSLNEINDKFGPEGISEFSEVYGRKGAITDDTQMTLFTAEGLVLSSVRGFDETCDSITAFVYQAYLRWLSTQKEVEHNMLLNQHGTCNIVDGVLTAYPSMHSRRAPDNTCLSALKSNVLGTINNTVNYSKGCGGMVRVAPVGLYVEPDAVFDLACEIAAITHGHPTGYIAAGCFAQIISFIIYGADISESIEKTVTILKTKDSHHECLAAIELALKAYEHSPVLSEKVEMIGGGWAAEEALGIGLYCALSAGDDFIKGVHLAVNHGGNSDSTGSITGNILGAFLGIDSIPPMYSDNLELLEAIKEMAYDLFDRI
jgi:ADP-ribosyl-[dinitrogen reductase] hydrolase